MSRTACWLRAGLLPLLAFAATGALALPDDAAVRAILAQRIAQKQGMGFAVVLIDKSGTRIVTAGTMQRGGPDIAADTEFEIGSITKTFTSLLLADAVLRGDVKLEQPVSQLLPAAASGLQRDGRSVTLAQLASHTSGLPRLPSNLQPADRTNPYADYDGTRLVAFLTATSLGREPPAPYEYSNLGAGLLGYALTYRGGGYAKVVRERILVPLAMTDTSVDLSATQQVRFAVGHDNELNRVPAWTFDALAGAGALRSTAKDMAKYLQAAMRPDARPLGAAFKLAESPIADGPGPSTRVGLAWHVTQRDGRGIVWHNGGTYGFASMLAFDVAAQEGVVVLGNAAITVDDLAFHLLNASWPLAKPRVQRVAIAVDESGLDRFAGQYELAPGFVLTVRREGGRLFAQATGQGNAEIFAESEYEFFYRIVDAQLSFTRDGAGKVTGVVLYQNGRDLPGKRLD